MKVLTDEQELLNDYLAALGMPLLKRICVSMDLWEEEATMEMLRYIAETEETDLDQLSKTAARIGRKYNQDRDEQELLAKM